MTADILLAPEHETHPDDDHMLVLHSGNDIPAFGSDEFKGGLWENAMPESTIKFLRDTPMETLKPIIGVGLFIDPDTGHTGFADEHKTLLPAETLDFIEHISHQFNQVGDWEATFCIQRDLGLKQHYKEAFHIESKHVGARRQFRAIINVSAENGRPDHETEWVATKGLTHKQLKDTFISPNSHTGFTGKVSDLPLEIQRHIQIAKTGDMLLLKGIGDGVGNDLTTDANIHRAPPFKNDFPQLGIRRIALSWERHLPPIIDPA